MGYFFFLSDACVVCFENAEGGASGPCCLWFFEVVCEVGVEFFFCEGVDWFGVLLGEGEEESGVGESSGEADSFEGGCVEVVLEWLCLLWW